MKAIDKLTILLILLTSILFLNFIGEAGLDIRNTPDFPQVEDPFEVDPSIWPTDVWSLPNLAAPLNITVVDSQVVSDLNITSLTYQSHTVNGSALTMFGEWRQVIGSGSNPTVVLLHGLETSHTQLSPLAEALNDAGYHTLALDLPSQKGRSDELPYSPLELLNESLLDQSGLRESTVGVLRGISLLRQISPDSPVFLLGYSYGGIIGLYTAALDPSLAGLVVLNAGGDIQANLEYGGLMKSFVPEDMPAPLTDPSVRTFLQTYDPLVYAHRLSCPSLFSVGTNDEFFSITSVNFTTGFVQTNASLSFVPELEHELTPSIFPTVVDWLGRISTTQVPPSFTTSTTRESGLTGEKVTIQAQIHGLNQPSRVVLEFQETWLGRPGWKSHEMTYNATAGVWEGSLNSPLSSAPYIWFVRAEYTDGVNYTSVLNKTSWSVPSPAILLLTVLGVLLVVPVVAQLYVSTVRKGIQPFTGGVEPRNDFFLVASKFLTAFGLEALFIYTALSLPWVIVEVYGSKMTWSVPQFLVFRVDSQFIPFLLIGLLYCGLLFSIALPRLGWGFNLTYSLVVLGLTLMTGSILTIATNYSYGFFLGLIIPALQFLVSQAFHRFLNLVVYNKRRYQDTDERPQVL